MFTINVQKHELVLWFRRGDFHRLLGAGRHFALGRLITFGRNRFERASLLEAKFTHRLLDVLVDEPAVRERMIVVDLADDERALVWKDGRLGWILGPGRHAFWKQPFKIDVEVFDVNALRFDHRKLEAVLAHRDASKFLQGVVVDPTEDVVLFRNGRIVEKLATGRHVFWTGAGNVRWQAVDLREQMLDVAGQEIMTADKVTLRMNLVVTYQVIDAVKAITAVGDAGQAIYREAQLALRAAVGARQLDQVLTDKEALGNEVRNALAQRADAIGVAVRSIGLRDVILPGDMKMILNQVIEARKQSEANLIRRREETAAARSQANTAKLLADNPVLARMKELEALQAILHGASATFIVGGGDMTAQLRSLVAADSNRKEV